MGFLSAGIPALIYELRGTDRSETPNRGGAALEYRFAFRRTARCGDLVWARSGLRGLGNKTQHFCHWILDPDSGHAWASAEAIAVGLDLETRRAAPLSEEERAHLQTQIVSGLCM